MIWRNKLFIETTTYFSSVVEQNWQWTWSLNIWSLKNLVRKLTNYFLKIIDKETESIENKTLFTDLKQNATLTGHFGPIYISFDYYPPYTGAISGFFKQILMHKIGSVVDSRSQIPEENGWYGLTRKVGKFWKQFPGDLTVNKYLITTTFPLWKYYHDEIQQSN